MDQVPKKRKSSRSADSDKLQSTSSEPDYAGHFETIIPSVVVSIRSPSNKENSNHATTRSPQSYYLSLPSSIFNVGFLPDVQWP